MKNNFQHTEILERINYAFVVLDKNWCLTYTNKTATELLNRNSDELIGKNIWELFPERIALPLHKAFLEAIETQQYIFLEEYYPPSNKWFENHIYPSPEGLSIYFRDITEKKKAEEEITESELNYRSLFEQASDTIFITGIDFHYIDINTSGCKLTGYSKDEFIKLTPNDLVFKEDMKANPFKTDQLKSGKTFSYERRLKRKDGTAVAVEANTKFLLDGRVVTFVRDITDRKKAEEEILQKNNELKALAAYLQNIREEERKEIARELHDELGQQLAAIKIDAKWLNKRIVDDDSIKNRTDEMLLQIDETIKTIREITSELRPEILDELGLNTALEWKVNKFFNHTNIRCNLHNELGELTLTPKTAINVYRIIQESLINIAKHSEATEVNIHLKVENKNLIILISDNGKGFDSEKIKQKKSFGLIGMKERAEMIGGTIQIVSEQGKGTLVELIVTIS